LLLAVAGALMITPGFVTDAIGFLILFRRPDW
jgi:FxsA cytoplasmic membrane protein.